MNVAIVSENLAYPPHGGNRIRTLNLMLRLARRHQIAYLCRAPEQRELADEARRFFTEHNIRLILVEDGVVPRKSGPLFYARLAANLLSPVPYAVALHNSLAMRAAIRHHAQTEAVDLWQFEWLPYVDALPPGHAPAIMVAHNVETLIWQRYAEMESHPLKRWYLRRQHRKFQRFEGRIFRLATRVVTVSREDAILVQEQFGVPHVAVVENGIDKNYFAAATGTREPHTILFLGSLDWRPNLDAAALLLDQIFPEVRRQVPTAQLCIVGRNPSQSLIERVRQSPQVQLHADVNDVRPYLAQSAVMAVPLRIGGGSRLKILEALACGLPVVSTAVGAEGLVLAPGRHLVVVESTEQMAESLVQCLCDPARAQALAEQGRQLVLEHYDWDPLADQLERVWQECRQCNSPGVVGSAGHEAGSQVMSKP
ncbi:MAG TPA: glycosyltransferase family 4 protein [Tepidisphaeraceae bacterium]|nr:glycosyltransferase family 4 protein [Tepidisphaeraceae bacterium]